MLGAVKPKSLRKKIVCDIDNMCYSRKHTWTFYFYFFKKPINNKNKNDIDSTVTRILSYNRKKIKTKPIINLNWGFVVWNVLFFNKWNNIQWNLEQNKTFFLSTSRLTLANIFWIFKFEIHSRFSPKIYFNLWS